MLAERKRKQKWSLNPRGKYWTQDTNKFGQKMLERMGWTEGKGLGRNENGVTEHIKVAYKNDSKGVGFKETVEWSLQQDNFSTLLEELNDSKVEDQDKPLQLKSLEEKSQKSRARVHYQKFMRGKDLSRYSSKDLANIFGRKKLVKEVKNEESGESTGNGNNFGVNTVAGGCIVDYFKNKQQTGPEISKNNKPNSDSAEEFDNFGFGFNSTVTYGDTEKNKIENTSQKDKKHKSKNKKAKNTFVSFVTSENSDSNVKLREEITENSENSTEIPKKRKNGSLYNNSLTQAVKKAKLERDSIEIVAPTQKNKQSKLKRQIGEHISDLGLTNPAFEPLASNIAIKKRVLETIAEDDAEDNINELDISNTLEMQEKGVRNKKKLKIEVEVEDNSENSGVTIEVAANNFEVQTAENLHEEKLKKKKKRKSKVDVDQNGISNPSFNFENILDISEVKTDEKPKKKKIKNKYKNQEGTENSVNIPEVNTEENPYEEKRRKKKQQSKGNTLFAIDNPTFNMSGDCKTSNASQEYEVKRKCKKLKGVDNPGLDLGASNTDQVEFSENTQSENGTLQRVDETAPPEIPDCDIMLNITDEPVKTNTTPKVNTSLPRSCSKKANFSKGKRDHVISDNCATPNDVRRRNELYDINTKVIQDGLRDLRKTPENHYTEGLCNQGFDAKAQRVEESVSSLSRKIDGYQAEVENGINESKARIHVHNPVQISMVGELNGSDGENERHEEGVKLRFKYAQLNQRRLPWMRLNDATGPIAKKSYKHLIRGDIIVKFKNSNLHQVNGYGVQKDVKK